MNVGDSYVFETPHGTYIAGTIKEPFGEGKWYVTDLEPPEDRVLVLEGECRSPVALDKKDALRLLGEVRKANEKARVRL